MMNLKEANGEGLTTFWELCMKKCEGPHTLKT